MLCFIWFTIISFLLCSVVSVGGKPLSSSYTKRNKRKKMDGICIRSINDNNSNSDIISLPDLLSFYTPPTFTVTLLLTPSLSLSVERDGRYIVGQESFLRSERELRRKEVKMLTRREEKVGRPWFPIPLIFFRHWQPFFLMAPIFASLAACSTITDRS